MSGWPWRCPCCDAPLSHSPGDAPFCWECGLYSRDHLLMCDEHHPEAAFRWSGTGWPRKEES